MTKRKPLLLVIVAVVLGAAGITAVVLSTGGGESASKPCDIPNSVREQPVPASVGRPRINVSATNKVTPADVDLQQPPGCPTAPSVDSSR
jgi:hypothetical protein